jgi:hypothetical protein
MTDAIRRFICEPEINHKVFLNFLKKEFLGSLLVKKPIHIASNNGTLMNNKLEGTWKEAVGT